MSLFFFYGLSQRVSNNVYVYSLYVYVKAKKGTKIKERKAREYKSAQKRERKRDTEKKSFEGWRERTRRGYIGWLMTRREVVEADRLSLVWLFLGLKKKRAKASRQGKKGKRRFRNAKYDDREKNTNSEQWHECEKVWCMFGVGNGKIAVVGAIFIRWCCTPLQQPKRVQIVFVFFSLFPLYMYITWAFLPRQAACIGKIRSVHDVVCLRIWGGSLTENQSNFFLLFRALLPDKRRRKHARVTACKETDVSQYRNICKYVLCSIWKNWICSCLRVKCENFKNTKVFVFILALQIFKIEENRVSI